MNEIENQIFVTFKDKLGRFQRVFWTVELAPKETIHLAWVANMQTILTGITPYKPKRDLFILDILVNKESQLTEPVPLKAYTSKFALPIMKPANVGDTIVIIVNRKG